MRPRKQKSQAPVKVEINFDPDLEDLVEDKEMKDIRYVKVTVKDRKLMARPDIELLAAPTEGAGPLVCPLTLHGPPTYKEEGNNGVVEFRAELAVDKIVDGWQTVEQAAVKSLAQPLPFRFTVGIQKEREGDPEMLERPGELRINLNRISWSWEALVRENGKVANDEGGGIDNPIEVTLDGSDTHGFRLKLELEERKPNGQYDPRDADFTVYLSPAVHEIDTLILAPDPLPWDLKPQEDKSQAETTWWTKTLPADHAIFSKLPIETTIRVRAYPYKSIKRHVNAGAPILDPPDSAQYAMREIPLHLGVKKWAATVLSPDPDQPPMVLEGARPWEECVHADVQLFAGSESQRKSVENTLVEWSFFPGSESCGTVSYDGQTKLTSGEWKVDDRGCVKFTFCPKRENALFLGSKDGTQYYANFNVRLKSGGDPDKSKIPSAKTPDDKAKASFKLEWAPKMDLGVFKVPFFVKPETPLDLESKPDNDKAESIPLTLSDEETSGYRMIFRTGGTVMLRPVVKWDTAGDGNTTDIPLQHYRLAVGDQARQPGESRNLLDVDSGSTGGWPDTVSIPPQSGEKGGASLTLHPEIPLHPEIVERFHVINEKSTKLDSTVTSNSGLTGQQKLPDWTNRFHEHGLKFGEQAVRYLCESPRDVLCPNAKGIRASLGAMAVFFDQGDAAWSLLGDAIGLHRQIYKRFEETLINFYFDVFGWDPIKKKLEPLKQAIEGLPGGKYLLNLLFPDRIVAAGYDKFQTAVLKSRLAVWVGKNLQELADKNTKAIENAEKAVADAERVGQEAGRKFDEAVQECGQHAASLQGDVDTYLQTVQTVFNQAQQLRASGVTGDAALTSLQPLIGQLNAAWAKVFETQAKWRASLGSAVGHFKAGASAASQRAAAALESKLQNQNKTFLETVSNESSQLTGKEKLEAEELKNFMDELAKGPDRGQGVASRSEATAALHDSLASGNATLVNLANEYDQTWRGLAARKEALTGRPFGAGVPVPNVGDEVSSYLERQVAPAVQQAQAEAARAKETVNDFVGQVNDITGRRFDRILDYWLSFFKVLEDRMEDAESQADMPLQGQMDQFLSKNEPALPDHSDLLGEIIDIVISAVSGLKNLIMSVLRKLVSVVKKVGWGILWLIILLLRGLFAVVSLLLTFVRGALGKWAELVASIFEWFREAGGGKFSALTSDAFTKGSDVAKDSGYPNLFDFPYTKEIDIPRRVKSAAEEFSKEPVWVDNAKQAISNLFKSGYEDYYPVQVQASRAFFFNLCQQILDRKNLEKPTIDSNDDAAHFGLVILDSQNRLKQQVANYQRAMDDASKEKAGIGASFWAEFKDARGCNAVDLDILVSWVGWSSALAFRFAGCCMAIAGVFTLLFTAPAAAVAPPVEAGLLGLDAVTVFGLFTAADFTDFITTTSRTILALVSYYPYANAYPRDATLMPALFYTMAFRPTDTRFNASDADGVIGTSHIDFGY